MATLLESVVRKEGPLIEALLEVTPADKEVVIAFRAQSHGPPPAVKSPMWTRRREAQA